MFLSVLACYQPSYCTWYHSIFAILKLEKCPDQTIIIRAIKERIAEQRKEFREDNKEATAARQKESIAKVVKQKSRLQHTRKSMQNRMERMF